MNIIMEHILLSPAWSAHGPAPPYRMNTHEFHCCYLVAMYSLYFDSPPCTPKHPAPHYNVNVGKIKCHPNESKFGPSRRWTVHSALISTRHSQCLYINKTFTVPLYQQDIHSALTSTKHSQCPYINKTFTLNLYQQDIHSALISTRHS